MELNLHRVLICLLFQTRSNCGLFVCLSFLHMLIVIVRLLLVLLVKTDIIFLLLIIIIVWRWSYIIGKATSGSSTLRGRRVLYRSFVWAVSWCIILWCLILVVIGLLEVYRILEETLYIDLEMLIFFVFNSDFERTCLWVIVAFRDCTWHCYWRSCSNLSNLSSFSANKFCHLALSGCSTWQWLPLISLSVNAWRSDTLCWAIVLVLRCHHLLVISEELLMYIKITQKWMLLFIL